MVDGEGRKPGHRVARNERIEDGYRVARNERIEDGYRVARNERIEMPAVGHRVVVRYLLQSGQATDALGMLLSADPATVVVDGKRGVETIAVADIVAAKAVPPAPAPRPRRHAPDGRDADGHDVDSEATSPVLSGSPPVQEQS